MEESIHLVIAECPVCGARRFRAPRGLPERGDVLSCTGCALKLSYGYLESRRPRLEGKPKPKRKAPARGRKRVAG